MVKKSPKMKVLRMKFSIVENVRMLRGIIFKLPRASQLPSGAKIQKSMEIIIFIPQTEFTM